MKTFLFFVLIIAVFAGGFWLTHRPAPAPIATGTTVTPTPTPQASVYKLIVVTPDVFIQSSGSYDKTKVSGSAVVVAGDTVVTGTTGRARLHWPNGTFTTLESNTTVTLTEVSDNGDKTTLSLVVGDIWSKITKVLGIGQYFQVQTQEAVAAVRGTVFRVSYHDHVTKIQGIEHTVKVFGRKANGEVDGTTTVDVSEGIQGTVDVHAAKKLSTRKLTSTELADPIYKRILKEKGLSDEDILKTPGPSVSGLPEPSVSVLPTLSLAPLPTPTPMPSVAAIASPTPLPPVQLTAVVPQSIQAGATFSLEGSNFTTGRNISRIAGVTVGGLKALQYSIIIGGTSIFVQPANTAPGQYDVSVTTTDGATVTLPAALTIQ